MKPSNGGECSAQGGEVMKNEEWRLPAAKACQGLGMAVALVCLAALGLAVPAAVDAQADQLYQTAVAQYNAGDYNGAIKNAEAAAQADPQHWQAWQLDGNARYALGDKQGALTVYKYSLQINPNNPQLKTFVDQLSRELQPAQPAPAAREVQAVPLDESPKGIKGCLMAPFRFLKRIWPF